MRLAPTAKGGPGCADTRNVGLLDNLRKRASEESDETVEEFSVPDAEPAAGVPDDDPWLATVERRRADTAAAEHPVPVDQPASFVPAEDTLGAVIDAAAAPASPMAEPLPDLGMVYAGLSAEGITPVPAGEPDPRQVDGPSSPDAEPHLAVLGLAAGASWDEIAMVRRRLLAENPSIGTAEQLQRRQEVNHASAALRLLYVD